MNRAYLFFVGLVFLLLALFILFITFTSHPLGLPCQVSAINGVLIFRGDNADLEYGNSEFVSLAYRNKGKSKSIIGPMEALKKLQPGAQLHAEFCSQSLVWLGSGGKEIYKVVQSEIDARALSLKIFWGSVALISFLVTLWGYAGLRARTKLKQLHQQ